MSIYGLNRLFEPRSIALIGGSPRERSVGRAILANLKGSGFPGELFVVNPQYTALEGIESYPTLAALPRGPDIVIITTPPAVVPQIVEEAAGHGCGVAIIITAGLGHGPGSPAQAAERAARRGGLRLVGPNCIGVLSPHRLMNASFAAQMVKAGDIALLSQSGAVTAAMIDRGLQADIGLSAAVSIGDQLDIDFGDLLDYFALDRQTHAILLYIEAVKDARKFMSAARAAARAKPVIVVKAGRTAQSANAATTHTGALAGSDAVYDAVFRRVGVLRVSELEELVDAAATLAHVKSVAGNRLAILTNGGGVGVLAVELLTERGGEVARLSEATLVRLNADMPPTWSKANPVDIVGDADSERYAAALEALMTDPSSDAVLVLNVQTSLAPPVEIARTVAERVRERRKTMLFGKPVFAAWIGNDRKTQTLFDDAGIPSYETESDAVRGFTYLSRHRNALSRLTRTPPAIPGIESVKSNDAARILAAALEQGRQWLDPVEANALLVDYGIPSVPTFQAATPDEAAQLAGPLLDRGAPVVVKILSRDIVHKSDVDGVRLALTDRAAVRNAAATILDNVAKAAPGAKLMGVTIQPMIVRRAARELIIGIGRDPTFGTILLFGHGGTAVEVINDRVIALPPLDLNLARDMIARTRVSRLLGAYRNVKAANVDAIATTLVKISQLAADNPDIRELDINPLLADENGVLALDARIKVEKDVPHFPGRRHGHFAVRPYPAEWERRLRLGHRDVIMRPIRAEDEPMFFPFLKAISDDDLRLRFFGILRNPDHAFVARLTQLDYARSMAFGAFDGGDGELLGVVRLHADPDYVTGEYAVLVRSDLKGQGLGWELMSLIINYARSEGLSSIKGQVLRENATMLQMCQALGFKATIDPGDMSLRQVELDLESPK
jgi:acetyltransferase